MRSKLVFDTLELNSENIIGGVAYDFSVNPDTDLMPGAVAMAEINFTVNSDTLTETQANGIVEGARCEFLYRHGARGKEIANLVLNGNFADTSNWTGIDSVSDGVATSQDMQQNIAFTNHKYYISFYVKSTNEADLLVIRTNNQTLKDYDITNEWEKITYITPTLSNSDTLLRIITEGTYADFEIKEIMVIDLNAAELENKTVEEIEAIFPVFFNGTKTLYIDEGTYKSGGMFTLKEIKTTNKRKTIKAYDDMHKFDVDVSAWLKDLIYPLTMQNMLNSLCTHCGMTCMAASITNGTFIIEENFTSESITGRKVLNFIAQLSGSWAYASLDGGEVYFGDYNAKAITLNNSKYVKYERAEHRVDKIDKVQIKSTAKDIGAIVGTGENALIIEGNPLAYAEQDSEIRYIAEGLYNKLKDIDYIPFTMTLLDDFDVNPGDIITTNGETTLVMSKKMRASGVEFNSTGNKKRTTQTGALNTEIIRLRGKTNELTRTVDTFDSRISTAEGYYSTITQTSNKITLVVGSGKLVSDLGATNASVIVSAINNDTSVTINANRISLAGKAISLTSENITISSTNFNVDKYGNINALGATLSGAITATSGAITGRLNIGSEINGKYCYISGSGNDDRLVFYNIPDYSYITPDIVTCIDRYGNLYSSKLIVFEPNEDNLYSKAELRYDSVLGGTYLYSYEKLKIESYYNMSIDTSNNGAVHIATATGSSQSVIIGTNTGSVYLKGNVYVNGVQI